MENKDKFETSNEPIEKTRGGVFVTGASGFIGRYVVERLLKKQYEVIVLIRNLEKYKRVGKEFIIEGTLNDCTEWTNKLTSYTIDACIHLAWEGIPNYSFEYSIHNLQYGINVLELCKIVKIKHLIVTGSCWEYENPIGKITESWEISSSSHNKASKNALRMIGDAFCKENGIQYNWLRLFYVYGPGQRSGSLIPHIINEFLQGRQPVLNGVYNENDFIYVTDVADAILRVLENRPDARVMNIASNKAIKVNEVVQMVAEKLDRRFDREQYKKSREIISFYGDTTLANKELKWKAEVSIEKGIDTMIKEKTCDV